MNDDGRRRGARRRRFGLTATASYGGRRRKRTGGRASPPPCAPNGDGGKRRQRRRRCGGAAGEGRRRRRAWRAWQRRYGARERTGDGANERGRRGEALYRLGLKRSNSKREKSIQENQNSVLEINSETNSIRREYSTIRSDSWGQRKRRTRGSKPLKNPEESGSDLRGFERGRRRQSGGSGGSAGG